VSNIIKDLISSEEEEDEENVENALQENDKKGETRHLTFKNSLFNEHS
jgi:hypothetical protein